MGLPIAEYKAKIVETIRENQVTIIVAETGAGKSTQVPQYLLEAGHEVIVTQPRRLAARTLAERVAFENGSELGDVIGYRTAMERLHSRQTKCLFVTDGLALIRELIGSRRSETILVIDEVHEWNLNIEVLVAYCKWLMKKNKDIKIVLMSATIEAEKLSAYFNDAPIISVPGRLYPIKDREPSSDILGNVMTLLCEGRNVLTFLPGKNEINRMVNDLKSSDINAEILPLHADLSPQEQAQCFRSYSRPKCVIATNVAQTSITINDIDAVVDSGLERRKELESGVEGLYLKSISLSDSNQRRGRAGRCRPGIYIDHCPDDDYHRPKFAEAEILRSLLDQTVLRLAKEGFDAEELDFFHQPDRQAIHQARESLKIIGCLDEKNQVTNIGMRVAKLPISVKYGRMLVAAQDLGVVSDVLTIVSILEVGGIIDRKNYSWRMMTDGELESDLLAQLAIYKASHNQDYKWLGRSGVHVKSLRKVREIRGHIFDGINKDMKISSTGKREDIIRAITSGLVEHVYKKSYGGFVNGDVPRQMSRDSVVPTYSSEWIVGIPFDLNNEKGKLRLVTMATVVNPKLLMEVAPQLVRKVEHLQPRYDALKKCIVSNTQTFFSKHLLDEDTVDDPNHPDAAAITANALNQQQWLDWKRPVNLIPHPKIDDKTEIPEIIEASYGRCSTTGVNLIAYGVLELSAWYLSSINYSELWTRNREDAILARENSIKFLNENRLETKARSLHREISDIRTRVNKLWHEYVCNSEIDDLTKNKLNNLYISVSGYSSTEVMEKTEVINKTLSEIELVIKQLDQKKLRPAVLKSTGNRGLNSFASL